MTTTAPTPPGPARLRYRCLGIFVAAVNATRTPPALTTLTATRLIDVVTTVAAIQAALMIGTASASRRHHTGRASPLPLVLTLVLVLSVLAALLLAGEQ